jgi:hypothetical protein
MLLLSQINIFPYCRRAAVSRWCTFENFRTTVILLFQDNLLFEVACWWINFVTFVRFFLILVWKTGTFLQILNLISMLRMQEMVLAGFKFQKFSGGACPQTPLGRAWPSAPHVDLIQNATVRLRRWIRPWKEFLELTVKVQHVTWIFLRYVQLCCTLSMLWYKVIKDMCSHIGIYVI